MNNQTSHVCEDMSVRSTNSYTGLESAIEVLVQHVKLIVEALQPQDDKQL